MLDRVRTRAVKMFILTVKCRYDAQKYIVCNGRRRKAKKGMKAIYSSLRLALPLPRLYGCIEKIAVLALKLGLESSRAAEVDLLSVEYL